MCRYAKNQRCNACPIEWDKTSPPILNEPKIDSEGMQIISNTELDPYKLFEESLYLSNPKYFKEIQRWVIALWQLEETSDEMLIAELLQQQQSNIMTTLDIIKQLTWCIQQTPPRFQLCWIGVKYYYFIL